MAYLVGIKETYNRVYGKRRESDYTIESTYLFISNGYDNCDDYMITIVKEENQGEFYNNYDEWEDYCDTDIEVFCQSNNTKYKFDCIEDSYASPMFYEQNKVLFDFTTNIFGVAGEINVIINKKNITLIDIDYNNDTLNKNYKDLFIAQLKFTPTKYFFQKMNYGYYNNQDIIKTIYLIISRFQSIEEMFLPKEIWEECILKMINW